MAELAKKLQSIVNEWTSCADCNNSYPEWADIKRGIIICLQCAGIHRSLGTHVSQVRSLTLDVWQSEWVQNMKESNIIFNQIYEYHVPSQYIKPNEFSNRQLRTTYITAKYVGLDTKTIDLQPLFHQNGIYSSQQRLSPIYDTASNPDITEEEEEGDDDENISDKLTKNGTKPWKDHRINNKNNKNNKNKKHQRKDSGMTHYTGVLHINCFSAINLPKSSVTGSKRSTYCSFDNGYQEVKTKIIKKNNNPQWDQNLILSVNENECIKIAIYTKDGNILCHQFMDIKDYGDTDRNYKIRNFEMIIHKKYKNNKIYKKEGKQIELNFDMEYNKMSNEIDSDINKVRKNRASLILDNTKISITPSHEMEEYSFSQTIDSIQEEIHDIDDEEEEVSYLINDDMDEYDGDSKQQKRDSIEIKDEEEEEEEDEEEEKEEEEENEDDNDSNLSSPSTSPPPSGRPGDTEDFFISYQENENEKQLNRVRLSANISGNIINEMVDELELKQVIDIREQEMEREKAQKSTHYDEQQRYIQTLIDFNNNNDGRMSKNGLNEIVDTMRSIIKINDNDTINILIESIRKLNEYIFFERERYDDNDDMEIDDDLIDNLREIRNKLMNNNLLSFNLMDIFINLSENKYDKQYLLEDLVMINPFSKDNIYIFKNILLSDDADVIEHILNEILKMNQNDSQKLHSIFDLIVNCINNNNVNVKKLSVKILSKFSKDIYVQKCIMKYSNEILRILSIIDQSSFINISYNMILNIDFHNIHYQKMKKYIVQQLVDEYDQSQYDENQNHILSLIKLENIKKNQYILKEKELIEIIDEHLDDLKENGLEYEDILIIAKSKQILNYQQKLECSLIIQSFVRGSNEKIKYLKILKKENEKNDKNKQILSENIRLNKEFNNKQNENIKQINIINEQQIEIEKLKQFINELKMDKNTENDEMQQQQKENNEIINELKRENERLKQEKIKQNELINKQKQEINEIKMEHLMDKQKFTITMMTEMNKLRNELKTIGQNQQKQQQQQILQQQQQEKQQKTKNGSYFGGLW